jgi:AAA15 family ATPase/GTPase
MRKNPNLINSVEVKYFRSINSQRIRECKPVNIITGSNDIGKSNLLRALNLFFNEKDEHDAEIVFREEFSHSRLDAVRKESVKGRQFIQIEVEFNCQDSFQKTLPSRFKVRKTWYRESKTPNITHDLERHITLGSLHTTNNKA